MFSLLALLVSALTLVSAAPLPARKGRPGFGGGFPRPNGFASSNCTTSASPDFPAGETNLTIPAGQAVRTVALGRGTQNYTCASGAWALQGALASLYDVTCLSSTVPSSAFAQLPTFAAKLPNPPTFAGSSNPLLKQVAAAAPQPVGHHYFVAQGNATAPKFDFTTTDPADQSLYVTLSKTAVLNAPTDPTTNVQWLQLTQLPGEGTYAKTVFRTDTAGGQPTGTCTTGQTNNVQYAALYYFYN